MQKKKKIIIGLILIVLVGFIGYKISNRKSSQKVAKQGEEAKNGAGTAGGNGTMAGPPAVVYKTKADFYDKLPLDLADQTRDSVVSYPDIHDINPNSYPTKLNSGYLLDNRGLSKNSAFLKTTYAEFGALEKTPTPDGLYKQVLEKEPFTEMYDCGNRQQYKDLTQELNKIIDDGKLSEKCKKLI